MGKNVTARSLRLRKTNDNKNSIPNVTKSNNNELGHVCTCGYSNHLPWWLPWSVVIVTMIVRINYVVSPKNWWILHPDEIYQSIEIAFSEVNGHGFRPYEFLPPPTNASTPADFKILRTGMFALRSFLYPSVFSTILYISKVTSWNSSAFLICKVFHVIVTSMLSQTVYWFVLKLFHCRLLAILACVLTATERHLVVFGTHTLSTSFLAPALFMGLTFCLPEDVEIKSSIASEPEPTKTYNSNKISADRNGTTIAGYMHYHNVTNKYSCMSTLKTHILKLKHIVNDFRKYFRNAEWQNGMITELLNKHQSACCFLKTVFGGFILGVVCYIRADTILFCANVFPILMVLSTSNLRIKLEISLYACVGGAVAVILCIINDISRYGGIYLSPMQWLRFNIFSSKVSTLFGTTPVYGYLKLFSVEQLNMLLFVSAIVWLFYCILKAHGIYRRDRVCAVLFSCLTLFSIYSYIGHKEMRFLHNVIILFFIFISTFLHSLLVVIADRMFGRISLTFVLCSTLSIFTMNSYAQFPSVGHQTISGWTYGKPEVSRDVNTCLNVISKRSDVRGAFINASVYDMAGFSIIKHNVPVLIKHHNEFYMFPAMRQNRLGSDSSIRVMNEYSDYIHQNNIMYLAKLIEDNFINYILTESNSEIISTAFMENFSKNETCGKFSLYHGNVMKASASTVTNAMPNKDYAAVLMHEADMLMQNGLYEKSVNRLEHAKALDVSRVRLYQQLFAGYAKLNKWNMVYKYQEECFSMFGNEECTKRRDRVVINK